MSDVRNRELESVLSGPEGFGVDVDGMLGIYRVSEEQYVVWCNDAGDYQETIFDSLQDAVQAFLKEREDRQLGLDYFDIEEVTGD